MRNKKNFTFFLICATVCALSVNASADVIRLNNGSSIKGCIIKKTESFCLLQTSLGTVNFPLKAIASVAGKSNKVDLAFIRCLKIEEQR